MKLILISSFILTCLTPFLLLCGFGFYKSQYCSDNSQCEDFEICSNNKCVCACNEKQCNIDETCFARNNSATCECLIGYIHDKLKTCRKVCSYDEICLLSEFCKDDKCYDVCTWHTCKNNEVCETDGHHRFICLCMPGYERNEITEQCELICSGDHDCDYSETCTDGKCINACIELNETCRLEDKGCLVNNHKASCQ